MKKFNKVSWFMIVLSTVCLIYIVIGIVVAIGAVGYALFYPEVEIMTQAFKIYLVGIPVCVIVLGILSFLSAEIL